jgi:hypothetical protein
VFAYEGGLVCLRLDHLALRSVQRLPGMMLEDVPGDPAGHEVFADAQLVHSLSHR